MIRFWVIHGFVKKSKGKHYEYWYNVMNEDERQWVCKHFQCKQQPCRLHNP